MQWHPLLLLDMYSVQVVQAELHVLNRLMVGGGQEAQADMEENDCHEWKITTTEHLEIR